MAYKLGPKVAALPRLNASVANCDIGGITLSVTVLIAPLMVAEIITGVATLTGKVSTVNPATSSAATVTLAGTVATAVLLLDKVTVFHPPPGPPDSK